MSDILLTGSVVLVLLNSSLSYNCVLKTESGIVQGMYFSQKDSFKGSEQKEKACRGV